MYRAIITCLFLCISIPKAVLADSGVIAVVALTKVDIEDVVAALETYVGFQVLVGDTDPRAPKTKHFYGVNLPRNPEEVLCDNYETIGFSDLKKGLFDNSYHKSLTEEGMKPITLFAQLDIQLDSKIGFRPSTLKMSYANEAGTKSETIVYHVETVNGETKIWRKEGGPKSNLASMSTAEYLGIQLTTFNRAIQLISKNKRHKMLMASGMNAAYIKSIHTYRPVSPADAPVLYEVVYSYSLVSEKNPPDDLTLQAKYKFRVDDHDEPIFIN